MRLIMCLPTTPQPTVFNRTGGDRLLSTVRTHELRLHVRRIATQRYLSTCTDLRDESSCSGTANGPKKLAPFGHVHELSPLRSHAQQQPNGSFTAKRNLSSSHRCSVRHWGCTFPRVRRGSKAKCATSSPWKLTTPTRTSRPAFPPSSALTLDP